MQTTLDAHSRPRPGAIHKNTGKVNPSVTKEKNKKQIAEQQGSLAGSEDGMLGADDAESTVGSASQRMILSTADGRAFLEEEALIDSDEGLDLDAMVSSLAQISLMNGMSATARSAMHSVALILEQLKSEHASGTLIKAMEERVDAMMAKTVEKVTESLKGTIDSTVAKLWAASTNMATSATQIAAMTTSYRDTLRSSTNASGGASPMGTRLAPRLQAREGVRARQVLLDVGMVNGSGVDMVRGGSIASLKERLDKALCRCSDGDSPAPHKTRVVSRLQNGGILMELDGTPAVDWFAQDNIWKQFLEGLPPGIVIKHRNFHVVVHYIPLTFRPEKEVDLREVEEANGLQMGDIVKARWCKLAARRSPRQTCGHAVFSFHSLEAANQVLTQGLFVCQKKVYAEKCKKEPLRCLKCQGWGHMARDCPALRDTCGTCAQHH